MALVAQVSADVHIAWNDVALILWLLFQLVGRPLLIILATFFAARFVSTRLRGGLTRAGFQINVVILLTRAMWIGAWALGLFVILTYFQVSTPVAAFIGVLGLAASLSLQQVLTNLVAGVYLLAERPFELEDVVAVVGAAGLNHEGQVEDIQLRTTHLRGRDGELILVPNSAIFGGVITNRSAIGGYATQISITFPRTTDPDTLRPQLFEALRALPNVHELPAPQLSVDRVSAETWTGCVTFWTSEQTTQSDAIWALASAFPDATINEPAPA